MADNNANPQQQAPGFEEVITGHIGFFHDIVGTKTKIVYGSLRGGNPRVKGGGFFFNFPWRRKAVKVSLADHKLDTIGKKVQTLENGSDKLGPNVLFDSDYKIKIVDPQKFVNDIYSSDTIAAGVSRVKVYVSDLLDERIANYIKGLHYDEAIKQNSTDLMDVIGRRQNGVFPANSINQRLLEDYGLEVTSITFTVRETPEMSEAKNKRAVAEVDQDTTRIQNETRKATAQTDADIKTINAKAAAEAVREMIVKMIEAGLSPDQVAQKLANEALVNGDNKNTIVMATTSLGQQGSLPGQNASFDMVAMVEIFNKIMERNQARQVQQQQQPAQQQQQPAQQQTQQQPEQVDWASLPDDQYLSSEDSVRLAAERGENLIPGARYHISYLTANEKQKYHVAAQNGRTR